MTITSSLLTSGTPRIYLQALVSVSSPDSVWHRSDSHRASSLVQLSTHRIHVGLSTLSGALPKVESFNSHLRAEFLNAEVFHNLADAQIKLSLFRNFYNNERKHSALKGQTPASFSKTAQDRMKEGLYSFE